MKWKVYLWVEKEYDILPFVVLKRDLADLTINNSCTAVTSSPAWHPAHNSVCDMTATTSDASKMRPPRVEVRQRPINGGASQDLHQDLLPGAVKSGAGELTKASAAGYTMLLYALKPFDERASTTGEAAVLARL